MAIGACALLGLGTVWGGCSKGGAPDLNGCVKLSDPLPGDVTVPAKTLYVELRTATMTALPVTLSGSGGAYSGSAMLGQCNDQGTYTVEKAVLVDINGDPVATAVRSGANFNVTYQNHQVTTVSGSNFANISFNYSAPATMPPVTVQSLTASPVMAKQGDVLSVQVAVNSDPCGVSTSQWALMSGSTGKLVTQLQTLPTGSGSLTIQLPPTLAPDTYFLDGQITLTQGGRTFTVHHQTAPAPATGMVYSICDSTGTSCTATTVAAASITVSANPDVDNVAPQVVSMDVSPAAPVRCGTVNLTLHISDDKGLPVGQKVKVWLGTVDQPQLTSTTVVGSEYLYGMAQVPLDAPAGVWYAYPDTILDAAGNAAKATITAGKFTVSGPGITGSQIAAGTFVVPSNTVVPGDMAVQVDLGGPQPDMAMQLPAVLNGITVSPSSLTMPGTLNVSMTWTDNAQILK